jgi:hypothetical protein
MKNINQKLRIIIGWLAIFSGFLIIGYGLFSAHQVFQGIKPPPSLFETQQVNKAVERAPLITEEVSDRSVKQAITSALKEVLPLNNIPLFLNISIFSLFIFILFSGGLKIATLGIKLLPNEKKENK